MTINGFKKFNANTNDKENVIITEKYIGTDYNYKHQLVWKNVIGLSILHGLSLWGFFIIITGGYQLRSFLWSLFVVYMSTEGVTIGAHRLYSHKSFKAKPSLKAVLILLQTIAGQNSIYVWCRDHRLHHKYSDTDGDPHNSRRGFFFSHVGWLMVRKHPYVKELGKTIDMSDLESDWMIQFQRKYYYILYFVLAVFVPVFVPYYYFGESLKASILVGYFYRYCCHLNGAWLVNSAAHLYGTRPYDKSRQPVESWFVSLITLGEGWHNYHHTFPWDYKAAELTMHFNASASIIRFFEKLGLAYDLKTASPVMVNNRIIKTGDGTHYALGNEEAKSSMTAVGPVHPLNPTYNVIYPEPISTMKYEGLPLYQEIDVNSFAKRHTA